MKCQNLYSGKDKQNVSKCRLLKLLLSNLVIIKILYCTWTSAPENAENGSPDQPAHAHSLDKAFVVHCQILLILLI